MPNEGTGDSAIQAAAGEIDPNIIVEGESGVRMVPLTALTGARSELKTVKEGAQVLQDQNDLYRANTAQAVQSEQSTVQADVDPFDGLEDTDAVTVADVRKVMSGLTTRFGAVAEQLKVGQGDPAYLQTIEKYLPGELAKDPDLAGAIKSSKNPALLALKISKGSEAFVKDQQDAALTAAADGSTTETSSVDAAQQIIDNQLKPGATSTGAGAGGGVNSVDFYKAMSDDDVEARIQKIQGNA